MRRLSLCLIHLADDQPLAREHLGGDEVPLEAVLRVEGKGSLLPLIGCE